jgi:hypothetical protein
MLGCSFPGVDLDFFPICGLEQFTVVEAELLGTGVAYETLQLLEAVRAQMKGDERLTGSGCAREQIEEYFLCRLFADMKPTR